MIINKIKECISNLEIWYNVQNYKIYLSKEFILELEIENTELATLLIKNVNKIQRQCDCYAIELLN